MGPESNRLLSMLDAHGAELHALLTRLTLRSGAAEDLLQDVFLKLRDSKSFAAAENPQAYLFRTAIHLAFDWRRRQQKFEPLVEDRAQGDRAPLDRLVASEELERILDAMELVSDLTRQCLVLRYLQHQEYAQIAAALRKTEHQARALCHKGVSELRALLKPEDRKS